MAAAQIVLKMKGMNKPQSFILYPYDGSDFLLIQSDKRIARLNVKTGMVLLSKGHSNGSYSVDLCAGRGAYIAETTAEELKTIQSYLWNNSGEQSLANGVCHFENKEFLSVH